MFRPQTYLSSVDQIDLGGLSALGIRGLLLDMDCTLKDYEATDVGPESRAWLESMEQGGIGLCLVSNGGRKRLGPLAESLGIPLVERALKPLPFGCWNGLRVLGLPARQVAMVGDQVFADIMAGRLAGLHTILVRPTTTVEPWFTSVKRPLERIVLRGLTPRAQLGLASDSAAAKSPESASADRAN